MINFKTLQAGPSFYNIFLQPYVEAKHHFIKAFSSSTNTSSLSGRVSHIAKGLLLAFPLINIVAMSIIFAFFNTETHQKEALSSSLKELQQGCPANPKNVEELQNYFCPRDMFPLWDRKSTAPNLQSCLADPKTRNQFKPPISQELAYRSMLLYEAIWENNLIDLKDKDTDEYFIFKNSFKELGYFMCDIGKDPDWTKHEAVTTLLTPSFLQEFGYEERQVHSNPYSQ